MEYSRDHLSRGTKLVGDHLSTGTKFLGTICPWGQNWLGTVCPEGPINWGPIVGDQMSGDHMCLGPNVSQPLLGKLEGLLKRTLICGASSLEGLGQYLLKVLLSILFNCLPFLD